MLRKLMKHELRATGRLMLPLFLLVLVTAIGANISTKTLLETDSTVLNILGVIVMSAFTIAIIAVCVMAFVLMIYRFYKNLLQDEGYVMMTLPVSVHQHIASKLLVSMLWFILSAIVVMLAFFVLVYDVGLIADFFAGLESLLVEIGAEKYVLDAIIFAIELVIVMFMGAAASCLNIYLSLAIGHSFANRKLLMSVVSYFVIQFALQIVFGIFSSIFFRFADGGLLLDIENYFNQIGSLAGAHIAMLVLMVAAIVSAAFYYFPTVWVLKNKLNLE